jgi:hypothetical protein
MNKNKTIEKKERKKFDEHHILYIALNLKAIELSIFNIDK